MMNLKREQEFVSQYHFDARNFEWENENGIPETKVDVNFQLLQHDQENTGDFSRSCFELYDCL